MRIESKTRNPRLYVVLIVVWAIFGIGSAICVSAGCPAGSGFYFDIAGNSVSCPSEYNRWQVMTALDIVSEAVLLALPVHLVYPLQMPRARKIMVVSTFWTRLPFVIPRYCNRILEKLTASKQYNCHLNRPPYLYRPFTKSIVRQITWQYARHCSYGRRSNLRTDRLHSLDLEEFHRWLQHWLGNGPYPRCRRFLQHDRSGRFS